MKKISKAVFPVGGMGTRFLPATKSIPKEMLPIIDKPLIQYAVEEAIEAGVKTLIFITSASKHAISDHFDPKPLLRQKFTDEGKTELVDKLDTLTTQITRVFIPQGEPLGLGHAVLQAKEVVDDEYFVVILADDYIKPEKGVNATKQLIDASIKYDASVISVEEVTDDRVSSYGIVDVGNNESDVNLIQSIVEKPKLEDAPSNLGVIGRYVLSPEIFALLEETQCDKSGEIQLTDALAKLLDKPNNLYAATLKGKRYDCGHKLGYVQATIDSALDDNSISKQVADFIHKL
ncbi:MAG TPA: UTP--glucose-1-phosphate uridylyltransferase [Gammaproteobacteria bacterium]|nr:UTP--glucose-1-phosphate uridylyltransferase [Xanthomonadales bacterium]MCB1593745.1 UTP--glucose-1-phosphate uridylyltransferase [Xanthomonadales bacterium]HOP22020.1 UTP--glucose-1-phosphate uridylyltransferase [Gammaproteobacteria bacterium]HPI95172.1 UTP--glucose-1-phosphate uridylyltransferase [Gammaproteobacteria bacterium]HPQ86709.1 UTP--glucose-1-phosphate uridylyltransferase [Gammaproteobacteria bacterium]